jgi:PAS domain S-box-containing protein
MAIKVIFAGEDSVNLSPVAHSLRRNGLEVVCIPSIAAMTTVSECFQTQDAVVFFVDGNGAQPDEVSSLRSSLKEQVSVVRMVAMAYPGSFSSAADFANNGFDDVVTLPLSVDEAIYKIRTLVPSSGDEAQPGARLEGWRKRETEAIKEFYERIIDTISDGIRVIDSEERRIVLTNRAHLEWIGKNAGEIIGAKAQDVPWGLCDDGTARVTDFANEAIDKGEPVHHVIATRSPANGALHWIDTSAYPMANAWGQIDHVVVVGRDITDRVAIEENLASERDRRHQVFMSAPIGILTTDAAGVIEFANPQIAQILGFVSVGALVGTNVLSLPQFQAQDFAAQLRSILEEGGHFRRDGFLCSSPLARETTVNIRVEPLFAHDLTITGLVSVIEDVTETVALQKRLTATTSDLAMLSEIGELFQDTRDTDLILQTILVGVTAGEGLGFNRAFLLTTDWETKTLRGAFAIGPSDVDEARRIWAELGSTPHSLRDILNGYRAAMARGEVLINEIARQLVVSLEDVENIAALAAIERKAFMVTNGRNHPLVPRALADQLGTDSFVVAPLIFSDRVEAVIIADNAISKKPITDLDLRSLELFAHQARLAVERNSLYGELETQLRELRETHALLRDNHAAMVKKERLAAMGQVAAQVAHEIRNPLVAIGGFARSIRKTLRNEDQNHEFAQIIVDETSRLENILREVLDFARPPELRRTAIDLRQLVQRTIAMMESELRDHNIETRLELPHEVIWVSVDADQIRQVLHNLVHNAVEAMTGEGIDGKLSRRIVTIKVDDHSKTEIVTTVEDTGHGLDDETRARSGDLPPDTAGPRRFSVGIQQGRRGCDILCIVTASEQGGPRWHGFW